MSPYLCHEGLYTVPYVLSTLAGVEYDGGVGECCGVGAGVGDLGGGWQVAVVGACAWVGMGGCFCAWVVLYTLCVCVFLVQCVGFIC